MSKNSTFLPPRQSTYSVIVSTNILAEWLDTLSTNILLVENPASLYPCAPVFLDMVIAQESQNSWYTLTPKVFSYSPRLRLSRGERIANLGASSRPKPLSQTLVCKPIVIRSPT